MSRAASRRGSAFAAVLMLGAVASCDSAGSAVAVDRTAAVSPSRPSSSTTPSSSPSSSPTATTVPAHPRPVLPPAAPEDEDGTGRFTVVPGRVRAPGPGSVRTVRVEVEGGLPVDAASFARFVMATLNDPRGWGHGGSLSFARTDGPAQVVVRLASPETSAAQCRPLITYGRLSCSEGPYAVLTSYRWLNGQSEFASLTQYRQYVVNHEVGHVLGHGHQQCPGAGRLAPVMQQQTKRVAPCRANAWPYP